MARSRPKLRAKTDSIGGGGRTCAGRDWDQPTTTAPAGAETQGPCPSRPPSDASPLSVPSPPSSHRLCRHRLRCVRLASVVHAPTSPHETRMLSPDLDGRTPSHAFRNDAPSPLSSVVLSRENVLDALSKSSDNGGTLDFAHKGLTDVGEAGAEEIATLPVGQEGDNNATVVRCGTRTSSRLCVAHSMLRIALAYNRLTTLPMAFALIARLRYLVLRNNNFMVFPHVVRLSLAVHLSQILTVLNAAQLTVMPSLEILDISRNKIRRLPSDPGSLVNLRVGDPTFCLFALVLMALQVFSILRNKIQKLPPSFARFQELTIFKVDGNPLEWPPKAIMDTTENLDDPQVMKEWLKRVQKWIEDNSPSRKMSEDSERHDRFRDDSDAARYAKAPHACTLNLTNLSIANTAYKLPQWLRLPRRNSIHPLPIMLALTPLSRRCHLISSSTVLSQVASPRNLA